MFLRAIVAVLFSIFWVSLSAAQTLDKSVAELMAKYGIDKNTIPKDAVGVDDAQATEAALAWAKVESPLEILFQRQLKLNNRPRLSMFVRLQGNAKTGPIV